MRVRKYTFTLIMLVCSLLTLKIASADVSPVNPWGSRCAAGELEIACRKTIKHYGASPLFNSCGPYEHNKDYKLLTYKKSFGDNPDRIHTDYIYCGAKGVVEGSAIYLFLFRQYIILLLATLLAELSVLFMLSFIKSLTQLGAVVVANVLSVFSLLLLAWFFNNNMVIVTVGEVLVYFFEVLLITKLTHSDLTKKIWLNILLANLISAVGGSFLIYQTPVRFLI